MKKKVKTNEEVEELDEAQRFAKETGKKYSDQSGQYIGGKNYDKLAAKQAMSDLLKKKVKTNEEVEELDEAVVPGSVKKDKNGNVTNFKSVPDEPNPKSHQAQTVLKHVKNGGSYGDRANAANIKPGISGVADRIAFLNDAKKRGVLKESDLEAMDQDEFDAIVENFEQLDEISKKVLGSYIKKANDRRGDNSISDHESEVRGKGVMTAAEKLTGGKAAGLQGLAMDARYAKSTGNKDAAGFKKTFDQRVDAIVKK